MNTRATDRVDKLPVHKWRMNCVLLFLRMHSLAVESVESYVSPW